MARDVTGRSETAFLSRMWPKVYAKGQHEKAFGHPFQPTGMEVPPRWETVYEEISSMIGAHVENVHEKIRKYPCSFCAVKFTSVDHSKVCSVLRYGKQNYDVILFIGKVNI